MKKAYYYRIGEQNLNNKGYLMTIVEYVNNNNIIVKFKNGETVKSRYSRFKSGQIASKTMVGLEVSSITVVGGLEETSIFLHKYCGEKLPTIDWLEGLEFFNIN